VKIEIRAIERAGHFVGVIKGQVFSLEHGRLAPSVPNIPAIGHTPRENDIAVYVALSPTFELDEL
jgi:hypothetical protein